MENNKQKLSIYTISGGFKDSDNYSSLVNSNISDDKWNIGANHLNLDDRLFSYCKEMNYNERVFGTRTNNELLSETTKNSSEIEDEPEKEEEVSAVSVQQAKPL